MGKVNQTNKCKTSCDPNYGYDPLDTTKICQLCKDYNYYNQNGLCVSACYTDFIADPATNICQPCLDQGGSCK